MEAIIFLFAVLVIFVAYFVKGFTGFGPALILIPTLSYFYAPPQVIFLSALLDVFGGIYLLAKVYRLINWKFVLPILALFFPGAYIGAKLLNAFDVALLKTLLGLAMIFFIGLIWFNTIASSHKFKIKTSHKISLPLAFLAGIGGGLFGISGPLLVIYFKLALKKASFRAQLIAIFAFGAAWRLLLYHSLGTEVSFNMWQLFIFITVMFLAVVTGNRWQLRINPIKFDRFVAAVLLIPSLTLLLF
ncbi:protein of unknown function DUF81 [Caldithrix abyssi DSM 13497]|uniref:Probable membrane transporter protein n=1 Tax=Caldithrix abyssi DSM 13497 TaxID=880073 RepID=H1XY76_CALAY|nr:sulfite exporter TauE/SafE family protein [Caldithrix abyssi]APF17948.1 putative membrane protein YfcA [Caldithrix abyssi DSM 13497]EHO42003.1 protein of unknown function DUF81 [Caldithrix abyssi DSM 13497]